MKTRNLKPFLLACGLHLIVFVFLIISFEKTIFMPGEASPSVSVEDNTEEKKVIEAVMVNARTLEAEKAKLEAIEAKKKAEARAREKELALKREQLRQEEVLMTELKKKNEEAKEALKKEAEKQVAEQKKLEAARLAQLKQAELAKQKALASEKARQEAAKEAAAVEKTAQQQRQKQDELSRYAMLMRNKIHQYWRQPIGMEIVGFTCKIAVRLLPTGEVLEAAVVQSSGNVEFDRSTELAVRKASPLPMPNDPDIAREFHQFTFTFKPEAV